MLFVRLLILMGWYHKILKTLLKQKSTPWCVAMLQPFFLVYTRLMRNLILTPRFTWVLSTKMANIWCRMSHRLSCECCCNQCLVSEKIPISVYRPRTLLKILEIWLCYNSESHQTWCVNMTL